MNPLRWDTVVARAILFAAAGTAILFAGAAQAQLPPALDDEVASRNAAGQLAGGTVGAVSATGRYVVFNTGGGLFRRDRVLGATLRVDTSATGTPGNNIGFYPPSISGDGRYVSFDSSSTYGVPDANGGSDIYVKDLQSGAIERVSVRTGGADITDGSFVTCTYSSISDNGNFVAFTCNEMGGTVTVFVRDRANAVTRVASLNQASAVTSGSVSNSPVISRDGRLVAFVSDAANLVSNDGNGQADAFVRDVAEQFTRRVSLATGGAQINGGSIAHVDLAGNCVFAFDHSANGIVAIDSNGSRDIFVHDLCEGSTEIVSLDIDGQPIGSSDKPSISADGRYVAFSSNGDPVGQAPFTSGSSVYVRDRALGITARGNLQFVEGLAFDSFAIIPRLGADGRQLIYTASGGSVSDQIVAVRNEAAPAAAEEDVDVAAFGNGNARDSVAASLNADGTKVVFVSTAAGFSRGWAGADSGAVNDVFVYDYALNCTEQASMSDDATNGDCDGDDTNRPLPQKGVCAPPEICSAAIEPSIDATGRYAVFVTSDGAVAKYRNETDTQRKLRLAAKGPAFAVVLRNLVTNATYRLGTGTAAGTGTTPRIAAGGGSVVFTSGSNLIGSDSNAAPDVYRQRLLPDGGPNGPPECVSCKDGVLDLPGGAANATVSANGMMIAFDQPNTGGGRDVLIRNLITGAITRVGATGAASRVNTQPSIDWSGARVAFQSGSNLLPGDANAFSDIYVGDTGGAQLTLMSGGNGPSTSPSFAGDGKSLAYVTASTDLDPNEADANGYADVHVQGVTGTLTGGRRATLARNRRGAYSDGASARPAMSYNGVVVAFDSTATNLLGEGTDTNNASDIFTRSVPFNADRLLESGFE